MVIIQTWLAETESAGRFQQWALRVSLSKLATSASAGVALGRRDAPAGPRAAAHPLEREARDRCATAAVLGKPRARGRYRRPKPPADSVRGAHKAGS